MEFKSEVGAEDAPLVEGIERRASEKLFDRGAQGREGEQLQN